MVSDNGKLIRQYEQLKSEVDRLQNEQARAEGALGNIMERLDSEYGVKTLKAAKQLRDKLAKEVDLAKSELEEALADFQRDWGDKLD